MNRKELQDLARIRLNEARALLAAGLPDGAYYLAGYSVECGLKACIAKRTRRYDFPEKRIVDASHTHNLQELVRIAGLDGPRIERTRYDPEFLRSWEDVQEWTERSRYERRSTSEATGMLEAVGHRRHGILPWLRHYW